MSISNVLVTMCFLRSRGAGTKPLVLSSKNDWVRNDSTVARRFELLANRRVVKTKGIDFQIRLQLVREIDSFHPQLAEKCDKKMTLPQGRGRF